VDGSESSVDALRFGAGIAAAFGAPLEAVAAWHLPAGFEVPLMAGWSPEKDAQDMLESAAKEVFGDRRPSWYRATTRRGTAAPVLIRASKDAQVLVVGSRGRGGFRGLTLGSTSAACAHHARCPVVIVRPNQVVA
jgi:nucleotide-binding universal stress UspA family protein